MTPAPHQTPPTALSVAAGVLLLVLGACAPKGQSQTNGGTTPRSAAAHPATTTPARMPPVDLDALELRANAPDAARGAQLSTACAGCHGTRGVSRRPDVPGLAGQRAHYTQLELVVFRNGVRPSDVMAPIARRLSDQDVADLAAYYARQPLGPAWPTNAADRERGRALFTRGDPNRNLMACAVCHGADGRGTEGGVASIARLPAAYAQKAMGVFRDLPGFGGIPHAEAMRIALHPLTDTELQQLAAYVSSMDAP
ncbi:c-type cytochrome [Deinococcus maricopensis]|uniref:Cytochrome c class I n=1 Tax=Deinococcus maricopensis (strain DSM 21211 / LMG 22137 / NRRL B-23946 / LB-34) TaxID=709986 RepID=E8U444_DEIML|nr:c-type cytochrome [Deinococcus maricopensis]ADV65881.1 cytochrome c class I [Deinococcus maricopensis DSM 21211]